MTHASTEAAALLSDGHIPSALLPYVLCYHLVRLLQDGVNLAAVHTKHVLQSSTMLARSMQPSDST
jgi:hypothetical protein